MELFWLSFRNSEHVEIFRRLSENFTFSARQISYNLITQNKGKTCLSCDSAHLWGVNEKKSVANFPKKSRRRIFPFVTRRPRDRFKFRNAPSTADELMRSAMKFLRGYLIKCRIKVALIRRLTGFLHGWNFYFRWGNVTSSYLAEKRGTVWSLMVVRWRSFCPQSMERYGFPVATFWKRSRANCHVT